MKKEKKVWALTLLAFWSLSPKIIYAQQQDTIRQLQEVTITATRVEQPIIEAPRSVTVISHEVIQRSVFSSVGELLSTEAGIYMVGATQTPGTNQSIFLRGASSNQTVIMINGMRITDPSSPNSSIDLSELSLNDVERIEIIRGSHSTLYGGSAIGGAINIITKKGSQNGFHGDANLQVGTFGEKSSAASSSVNLNYRTSVGFYVRTGVFHQSVKGMNATIDTIQTKGVYKSNDKDDFEKTDVYGRVGFLKNKWDVFVSARKSRQHAEIDDRAFDDDDNAYLEFNRTLWEYQLRYQLNEDWNITANGSWSPSRRFSRNDSSLISDAVYDKTYSEGLYSGKTIGNEMVMNYARKGMKGLLGFGHYDESMDFETFYFSNAFGFPFESKVDYDTIDTSSRTTYLFGQASYDWKKFTLKAGSRLSNHSRFGEFLTFELSPSYRMGNALLYGSLSSGFNAPSLYQLYDPTPGSGTTIVRGNSNLKPEKSLSVEVGLKKEYNSGSYFTVSAFTSVVKNNIEYVYLWDNSVPVSELTFMHFVGDTYLNIANQKVSGVELSGRLAFNKFYLQGNVSVLKGGITIRPESISKSETDGHHVQLYNYGPFATEDIKVNTLVRRPRLNSYIEAGFKPSGDITIMTSWRLAGSRNDVEFDGNLGPYGALAQARVQQYNLVDIGCNYQVNKTFGVSFKIENVFDQEYSEIHGFQTRGRSAYIKANVKW